MEFMELTGLLAARSLKLLRYTDPIIASAALLLIAFIAIGFAGRCVFIFVSLDRYDSREDKVSTVIYGIGYLLFSGLCLFASVLFFEQSQSDRDSFAYGWIESLERPDYLTPEEIDKLPPATNPLPNRVMQPFGEDQVEVRQPDRNRSLDKSGPESNRISDSGVPNASDPMNRNPDNRLNRNGDSTPVDVRLPSNRTNSSALVELPTSAPIPLPKFQYSLNQAQKSKFVGAELGQDFRGHGPAGSVMVGMRIGTKQGRISGFEPIYQLESQYVTGEACGSLGDSQELVLAKPGFVVGGAIVAADSQSLAMQLRFVKYNQSENGLDTFDQYDSERIGRASGSMTELDGDGAMVVGVFGKLDGGQLCGLGVAGLKPSSPEGATSTGSKNSASDSANSSNAPSVSRVWFSKDRKFSVEAKFREYKNGKVVLEKPDGTVIEVDPAGLCEEDDKYLKSR
ncbi:MAG: hypothetical protein JNL67_06750 [Planctomycetaceae bacterium]|nr:hypothetical protein [Planctomycetaceae bacterium]